MELALYKSHYYYYYFYYWYTEIRYLKYYVRGHYGQRKSLVVCVLAT